MAELPGTCLVSTLDCLVVDKMTTGFDMPACGIFMRGQSRALGENDPLRVFQACIQRRCPGFASLLCSLCVSAACAIKQEIPVRGAADYPPRCAKITFCGEEVLHNATLEEVFKTQLEHYESDGEVDQNFGHPR